MRARTEAVKAATVLLAADGADGSRACHPRVAAPRRAVYPTPPPVLVYVDLDHYMCLARTAAGPKSPVGYDGLLPR